MGKVEPHDVHTRDQKLAEHGLVPGCGADGGDDGRLTILGDAAHDVQIHWVDLLWGRLGRFTGMSVKGGGMWDGYREKGADQLRPETPTCFSVDAASPWFSAGDLSPRTGSKVSTCQC